MPVRYLESNTPDGVCLGQSATDKISFYGATPITQGAGIADIATNATGTAISVAVNALISRLESLGLIATSS